MTGSTDSSTGIATTRSTSSRRGAATDFPRLIPRAKLVFWDRFAHWTEAFGFVPWITTLLNNDYHTLGYLRVGDNLGPMMQRIHGSVAKLVNDVLPVRHVPFWRRAGNQDYFDGCIRDVLLLRRAYHYTKVQAMRAGLVRDYRHYPHTRINVDVETAVARAGEMDAFLEEVPYARYDRARQRKGVARGR
jgi:hypothetical protein